MVDGRPCPLQKARRPANTNASTGYTRAKTELIKSLSDRARTEPSQFGVL